MIDSNMYLQARKQVLLLYTIHIFRHASGLSVASSRFSCFGTKNLYSVSRAFDDRDNFNSAISNIPHFHEYIPVHVNGIIRHGTRNPGIKDLTNFKTFLNRLELYVQQNGKSSSEAIKILYDNRKYWLSNKTFPNAMFNDKELVQAGYEELHNLGKFVKTILPGIDNSNGVQLISSEKQRCVKSLEAFRDGLGLTNETNEGHTINNQLLRFYDYCELYLNSVSENETSQNEHNMFKEGPEITSIVRKLQRNIQPNDSAKLLPIPYKELKSLYTIAACELAVYGTSNLTELFDQNDLHILEYAGDLRSYWKRSYGHWINYAQGCGLLKHIVDTMKDVVYGKSDAKNGVFRFGHAETLLPVMGLLELYKDNIPLNANNFHLHRDRLFKTSKIMPFAGNLLFVLYRHARSSNQPLEDDFKVMLLHNEKPIHLPPCSDGLMCSFRKFIDHYAHWTDHCNFEDICSVDSNADTKSHEEL